jgi:transcriptional regulator with XRE-family HTH domain
VPITAAAEQSSFGLPVPGLVRRVRRIAGISQRELAVAARLSRSTISRIEKGTLTPSLPVFERILGVAGLGMAVINDDGRVILPMRDREDARDGADRRYPSHLDTILDPEPGEWWGDQYGLARPPETFHRDRRTREMQRRRSQWEVRVKKYRDQPPPPQMPGYY